MIDNVDVITKTNDNVDLINNPQHYACEAVTVSCTVEPIELCEQCGFLLGNALKYLFRYQHKGKPLEDLKKARYYLERLDKSWDRPDVNTFGFNGSVTRATLAFKDKEFFKHVDFTCSRTGTVTVTLGLLKFVNEKIDELEAQSVEMDK